jgi:hypothetical protein
MLKIKQPINFSIVQRSTTVTTINNDLSSRSTYAENFRSKFTYGNSPIYRTGFMLKNLKRAIGNDQEALKHIKKYRTNLLCRTAIFCLGLFQTYSAIKYASTGNPPFGLSKTGGIIAVAPGLIFSNWFNLFPQKYKAKNLRNAVDAYNRNLKD